jgi:hypothetical protein
VEIVLFPLDVIPDDPQGADLQRLRYTRLWGDGLWLFFDFASQGVGFFIELSYYLLSPSGVSSL